MPSQNTSLQYKDYFELQDFGDQQIQEEFLALLYLPKSRAGHTFLCECFSTPTPHFLTTKPEEDNQHQEKFTYQTLLKKPLSTFSQSFSQNLFFLEAQIPFTLLDQYIDFPNLATSLNFTSFM